MSNKYYQLYIESIIDLVETITIKSEQNAKAINESLVIQYGVSSVDVNNPYSWKYYQNISGQYHVTDEVIYITSLDTANKIEFTKDNLDKHPITKASYLYGTRYYRELVTKYPAYEQLILGILYPADINVAINSPNHTILSYPKYLVEENEINFIPQLQDWIYKYKARWYNLQFNNNHIFYNISNDGVMFAGMVGIIINLRMRACKTKEAHSFHVREYLASHGMLDEFLDQMTLKQAMFFYRNIAYIERNNGKIDTFEWLVDKVLTDRSIPLAKYTMRHDITNISRDFYPEVKFRKSPLNSVYSNADEQTHNYTLEAILDKETPLAPDNLRYSRDNISKIRNLFIDSPSSVVQTKMLESSITDYTGSTKYTLQTLGLNYWVYLASKNIYTGYVRIPSHTSGQEILLTPMDAYIYYICLFARSVNVEFQHLPILKAFNIFSTPAPPVSYLMSLVDPEIVSSHTADVFVSEVPTLTPIRSPSAFAEKMNEIHSKVNAYIGAVAIHTNSTRRGMVQAMMAALFTDVNIEYAPLGSTPTRSWIDANGLTLDIPPEDCPAYCNKIFEAATGISTEVTSNTSILQKAMLGIMSRLSSYSIQFLSNINQTNLRPLGWTNVRFDDPRTQTFDYEVQELPDTLFTHIDTSSSHQGSIPVGTTIKTTGVSTIADDYKSIEIPSTGIRSNTARATKITLVNVGRVRFHSVVDDTVYNTDGPIRYMNSLKSFYDLTPEERRTIKSIYGDCMPDPVEITQLELSDAIERDTISSFTYNRTEIIIKAFNYQYIPDVIHNGVKIIISDDLNGLVMSGGTFRLPGLVSIGFDHYLDALEATFQPQVVPGLMFNSAPSYQPHYALHGAMGVGESVTTYVAETTGTNLTVGTIPVDTLNLGGFKIVNGKITFA